MGEANENNDFEPIKTSAPDSFTKFSSNSEPFLDSIKHYESCHMISSNILQLDGNISIEEIDNFDSSLDNDSSSSLNILQVDGNESEEDVDETKSLFTVNCEIDDIIQIISFFRSCQFLWDSLVHHSLCTKTVTEKCYLCFMRSSLLRLNVQRKKGPKSLKMIEMLSQLDQLQSILDCSWKENIKNIPMLVEKIFVLLQHCDQSVSNIFRIPLGKCKKCGSP